MTLSTKYFWTLKTSTTPGRYLVYNDGKYVTDFYAGNDYEAMQLFRSGGYKKRFPWERF